MEQVITQVADPVVDYVFGGFSLLLMICIGALLWYGISAWRADQKEASAKYAELAQVTATVVSKNSASIEKLSVSLDRVGQHQDELNRRLLSRPCLKNGIERE